MIGQVIVRRSQKLTICQECLGSPPRARTFNNLIRSQPRDPTLRTDDSARLSTLRTALRGYRATVDAPTTNLYRELMALYPSAKVILNVRDSADAWWTSVQDTLGPMVRLRPRILAFPVSSMRTGLGLATTIVGMWYSQEMYGPEFYRMHNEEVRRFVPQERLLEFNVKEGWGPLCKFLEVPEPDTPFPHL